jgi:hypothetical protein
MYICTSYSMNTEDGCLLLLLNNEMLFMNVLLFREMTALHAAFAPKIIELAEQGRTLTKRNNQRQKSTEEV